jgi:Uma2 family endonuclease
MIRYCRTELSARTIAMTVQFYEEAVQIPAGIADLDGFRRWAKSAEFPRRGRFAFLRGKLWVDMSMEQAFSHNRVKLRFTSVLDEMVRAGESGYVFGDRMLLSNPTAGVSNEPDVMYVSFAALDTGRVTLVPGADGGFVEVLGSPDMVLEVVSNSSAREDTQVLVEDYWRAGIPEYWLVDARGEAPAFDILRAGPDGYVRTRRQSGGWLKSPVFGRSFRFTRSADARGNPRYEVGVRP